MSTRITQDHPARSDAPVPSRPDWRRRALWGVEALVLLVLVAAVVAGLLVG
jgi:hypothetical protein